MNTIQVACAIIFNNGKILVAQRSEKMTLPLKWEFPGGKIDLGETEEDCLHREINEEINIKVQIESIFSANEHDYGNIKINLISYIAKYIGGEIVLLEHKQARWLTIEELKTLDWAEADLPILDKLIHTNISL